MPDAHKILNKAIKKGLEIDPGLHKFLNPIFNDVQGRHKFIKKCLRTLKARRMLLRAQWYTEIAEHQSKMKYGRPALRIIFLMSMAESLAKARTNSTLGSLAAIKAFFKFILKQDREFMRRNFRRALLGPKISKLRFSSIIRILYEVRNQAVHGEDFFSFSLMDAEDKKEKELGHYTHYGTITSGDLVKYNKKTKKKNRQRVSLDISLTYTELSEIFSRTAIENIKAIL